MNTPSRLPSRASGAFSFLPQSARGGRELFAIAQPPIDRLREAEEAIDGPFNPTLSSEIDRALVAVEAEGEAGQ